MTIQILDADSMWSDSCGVVNHDDYTQIYDNAKKLFTSSNNKMHLFVCGIQITQQTADLIADFVTPAISNVYLKGEICQFMACDGEFGNVQNIHALILTKDRRFELCMASRDIAAMYRAKWNVEGNPCKPTSNIYRFSEILHNDPVFIGSGYIAARVAYLHGKSMSECVDYAKLAGNLCGGETQFLKAESLSSFITVIGDAEHE